MIANGFRLIAAAAALCGLVACATTPKTSTSSSAPASASTDAAPAAANAVPAPAPPAATNATSATTPQSDTPARKQYKGVTDFPVSPVATRGSKFLTPFPKDRADQAAHLPDGMNLCLPFRGTFKVSNGYGCESGSWTHQTIGNTESANDFFALDIGAPVGTPVVAVADGRVLTAQDRTNQDSYGKYIVIDHGNGVHSIYAHLDTMAFEVDHGKPEIQVKRGESIGTSGKSGGQRFAHLHFGLHKDSRISQSGCDVGGLAVIPEPLGGYYGIRSKHVLSADEVPAR